MKAHPAHDPGTPPVPGPAGAGRPRPAGPGTGPGGGVLILNWRDTTHPEGGGSEVYVERIAAGLAAQGRPVTLFCAAHPGAPAAERVGGIRVVRRGGRLSVYPHAWWAHLTGRLGGHEVVVDVQNGLPFLSALWCRPPLGVLVHHVARPPPPRVAGALVPSGPRPPPGGVGGGSPPPPGRGPAGGPSPGSPPACT